MRVIGFVVRTVPAVGIAALLAACSGAGSPGTSTAPSAELVPAAAQVRNVQTRATATPPSTTCSPVTDSTGAHFTAARIGGGKALDVEYAAFTTPCDIGIYVGPSSDPVKITHTLVNGPFKIGIYVDGGGTLTQDTTSVCVNGEQSDGVTCATGTNSSPGTAEELRNTPTVTIDSTNIDGYVAGVATNPCPNPANLINGHTTTITDTTYPWGFNGGTNHFGPQDSPRPAKGGGCAGSLVGAGMPAQQLFISNLGSNTVSIYPISNLTTATPTIISNGVNQAYAMAMDAAGDLFVSNSGNNTVTMYPAGNYTGTPTIISNGISGPGVIALDSHGDLFVANGGNSTVTEYLAGNYTALAATISTGVSTPLSVALNSEGDVFVANCGGYCGGTPAAGTVTEYAAGNFALTATITKGVSTPNYLVFDSANDLFVIEDGNSTVTEHRANHYLEAPTVISAGMSYPYLLSFDAAGDLFVPQVNNSTVTEYPAGSFTTSSPTTYSNGIYRPLSVAFDVPGDLFVVNQYDNVVMFPAGNFGGSPITITNGVNNPSAMLIR